MPRLAPSRKGVYNPKVALRGNILLAIAMSMTGASAVKAADSSHRRLPHGMPYEFSLNRVVGKFEETDEPFSTVASLVARENLCVAVEVTTDDPHVTVSLTHATVRQILDAIVSQAKGYRWGVRDGVIGFSPIQISTGSPLAYLNEKAPPLSAADLGIDDIVRVLTKLTREKGNHVIGQDLYPGNLEDVVDRTPADARTSIVIDKSWTVRDALDRIIRADPPSLWWAYPVGDGRLRVLGGAMHEHALPSSYDAREKAKTEMEWRERKKRANAKSLIP